MSKTLESLHSAIPISDNLARRGDMATIVSGGVVESSRDAKAGSLFVARKGQSADGHDFIHQAIVAGAVAVVGEKPLADLPVPYIQVRDASAVLGHLAAAFNDYPSRKLIVIGVTGTDGKTTTCHLLHSILKHAKIRAGFISTISADFGDATASTGLHVTTPGAPQVQEYLVQMADAGLTHCILEMTSHGLSQGRLNGVDIDLALLTNVAHEHMDFHGSWANYRDAKAIMFRMLSDSFRKPGVAKTAIINADDPAADFFRAICSDRQLTYAVHAVADFQAKDIRESASGSSFQVAGCRIDLRLPGKFNMANALAAIAAARALGVDWTAIQAGVAAVELVSGRMERIDEGQDFKAIVDFAHTPKALESALIAGRQMLAPEKRLIVVFGSAGLRDVAKRRMMAETAAKLADLAILTAEDPRTESLDDILEAMAEACREQGGIEGETYFRLPDRGEAIYRACQLARPGDLVMACGKGHEQSMCFGTTEYPWDDRDAMRAALRGEPLRTLPTAGSGR